MKRLQRRIKRYLNDTLGTDVTVIPWENTGHSPPFMRERYQFFRAKIMGRQCLFMVDKGKLEESPATVRKHIDQVQSKWNEQVVYVRERITAYNRKRLVEHKAPFIVPGNQMYLPMFGIDLREHFRRLQSEKSYLGPAAQVVLIHALLRDIDDLNLSLLAKDLRYTPMTMSRAFDELENTKLCETIASGRERHLRFTEPKRAVWEKAQPLLRDPVIKRNVVQAVANKTLPGPISGLSALAHYSMLAEPKNVIIALSRKDWNMRRQKDLTKMAMPDEPEAMTVEIWSYSPMLFARDGWVDRLSLYLSFRNTQDERVQTALDRMIREIPW